jgi:MoxR-like ATPase
MASPVTASTTREEMEVIITETIGMMKKHRVSYSEERVRRDLLQRRAELGGLASVEELEASWTPTPDPIETIERIEDDPEPEIPDPAPVAEKVKRTRTKGVKIDGSYFYEKDTDRAVGDTWLALNNSGVKMHMLSVGPSGCGKTEGFRLVATRAGVPLYKVDIPAMTTTEKFIGHKEVNESGTHYVLSEHLKWVGAIDCEPGIVLYDEISRAHPSLLNILLPLLDGSKRVWVPDLGTFIDVHPKTVFAATANIGIGFSGTYAMDTALHDRFGLVMERTFPPAAEEVKVLVNRTGITDADAKILVDIANQIRTKNADGTVSKPVSTRALLDTAALVSAGMSLFDACEYTWVKKYSDDGGPKSERTTVRSILSGKVKKA